MSFFKSLAYLVCANKYVTHLLRFQTKNSPALLAERNSDPSSVKRSTDTDCVCFAKTASKRPVATWREREREGGGGGRQGDPGESHECLPYECVHTCTYNILINTFT